MENNSSTLQPLYMPDFGATTCSRRRFDWVLLDNKAHIANLPNATTVEGFTPAGQAVQVTFWLVDPPGLSHLCVHCPGLEKTDFAAAPRILCWEKDVAILEIRFTDGPGAQSFCRGPRDYFVYKADREHPSLHPLPVPPLPLIFDLDEVVLFPSTDDGGKGFHIAVLRPPQLDIDDYDLHTFSSKTWTWSSRLARLPRRATNGARIPFSKVDKVIVLEGDLLGFVDLWKGIILCRVLDESPYLLLHHIWLPRPLGVNAGLLNIASQLRDVVCINGVIKFVEIGNRTRRVLHELSNDLRHNSPVLHDSDLEELGNFGNLVDNKDVYVPDGWSIVTWKRLIRSDCWTKDCEFDINDVTIPRHLSLPLELSSSHSGKVTLNKSLITTIPTLDGSM
ncbi:hypothetical protein QOZ80_3BG0290450 [Eleusine coracana subsp. coracana]|nr:hypothetical protein QOZ80_3BG0290450 [Eleusine coracana subsp. coracana]